MKCLIVLAALLTGSIAQAEIKITYPSGEIKYYTNTTKNLIKIDSTFNCIVDYKTDKNGYGIVLACGNNTMTSTANKNCVNGLEEWKIGWNAALVQLGIGKPGSKMIIIDLSCK
jgi:hypothetical protein